MHVLELREILTSSWSVNVKLDNLSIVLSISCSHRFSPWEWPGIKARTHALGVVCMCSRLTLSLCHSVLPSLRIITQAVRS